MVDCSYRMVDWIGKERMVWLSQKMRLSDDHSVDRLFEIQSKTSQV